MIEELRKIGLSDLEARCYLALHEESSLSGYEVAKRVSVSRTNVYAALRLLSEKGICRMIEADPVLYEAVPIGDVIRLLKADFERSTDMLLEELTAPPKRSASFGTWKGDKAVELTLRRLISGAQHTILVDLWEEDLDWFEQELLAAENRGVEVAVMLIGRRSTALKTVVNHSRPEHVEASEVRRFTLLCDRTYGLIGSFGRRIQLSALESDHPAIAGLLESAFMHDLIVQRIEEDFGAQLEAQYGRDYQTIRSRYGGLLGLERD
ncbi:TrmB family transcriptional regulator [Saccharibacillus sp. O16]|nr:TrmB family transcriptional regulator [Saccharibacillus sp. O16]